MQNHQEKRRDPRDLRKSETQAKTGLNPIAMSWQRALQLFLYMETVLAFCVTIIRHINVLGL